MQVVKFKEEGHVYTVDGQHKPSVTTVIDDIPSWLRYKQFFVDAGLRGTRVHAICADINHGKKPVCEIPEDEPYVAAYQLFRRQLLRDVLEVECVVYNTTYDYTGTLDLVAKIDNRGPILIDIKTVHTLSPTTALQTAAYIKAYNQQRRREGRRRIGWRRAAVQLRSDGTFRMKHYRVADLQHDFDIFLAKLKSWRWDRDNLNRKE